MSIPNSRKRAGPEAIEVGPLVARISSPCAKMARLYGSPFGKPQISYASFAQFVPAMRP